MIGRGSSNGIDTTYFSRTPELERDAEKIRELHSISSNEIVFSFVGRVVRDKGIVELVEAFKKLKENLPSKLIIVGPFEQELDPLPESVIKFLHEDQHVICAGYQNDVRPWLMASDVFVFPSYREGFPNVVMQAACLELPSIVSDINGCNEIIEQGVTGWIVPPKNENALYVVMMKLSGNQKMRNVFGKKSREYVVANFDQQFVWGELLKEYKRLLVKEA
jgi:glycosyltransferase involved in cell wall biosynthesis